MRLLSLYMILMPGIEHAWATCLSKSCKVLSKHTTIKRFPGESVCILFGFFLSIFISSGLPGGFQHHVGRSLSRHRVSEKQHTEGYEFMDGLRFLGFYGDMRGYLGS